MQKLKPSHLDKHLITKICCSTGVWLRTAETDETKREMKKNLKVITYYLADNAYTRFDRVQSMGVAQTSSSYKNLKCFFLKKCTFLGLQLTL